MCKSNLVNYPACFAKNAVQMLCNCTRHFFAQGIAVWMLDSHACLAPLGSSEGWTAGLARKEVAIVLSAAAAAVHTVHMPVQWTASMHQLISFLSFKACGKAWHVIAILIIQGIPVNDF
jgi:hypothetical protein